MIIIVNGEDYKELISSECNFFHS